jgi:outer membrane receptor protein involved in Fe transport
MNIKAGLFVGTMLTALVSQPAAAQVVGEAKNQPDASGPGDVASDIVVTGSRIGRNGNEAPTPVTVVSVDQLQQSAPRSIAEGLNQLPQFLGSFSPAQSQSTMLSEAHGNILNLRNAGAIRTLILMDGQRVPPTSSSGLVDVSVIPEALVARVDVVTAGASAVYGSDAVTGVVNFILDSKFTGVKALAQRGVSSRGDGGSYRLGVTAGTSLLDGGAHLLLSADRNDSTGIQKLDRPYGGKYFFAVPELPGAPGTASNPLVFKENVVSSNLNATGLFRFGPPGVQGQTLTPGGQITPFNPGRFAGAGQQIGGSGTGTSQNTSLITGLRTDRLFGRLSFDIAPNFSG